jgi:hypothetical protein
MSDDKDLMLAYFENQQLDRLKDYLRRGRPLVDVEDEELTIRWIGEFRQWASNLSIGARTDHGDREDIEAEFQMRGKGPPFDLVPAELKALKAASRAYTDRLFRDPVRLAKAEREMSEELDKFERSSKGKPSN